jgi:drug/metabolite transporter (DMT)-like permease
LLGAAFLRERLTAWRIAACCMIAAGAAACVGWRF